MGLSLSGSSGSPLSDSNGYYVYALRRDDDDMLWLTKVSAASTTETGAADIAFRLDGTQNIDVSDYNDYVEETTAEKSYTNHPQDKYQQIRFDKRNLNYFIDSDGYFVLKVNETYDYNTIGPK